MVPKFNDPDFIKQIVMDNFPDALKSGFFWAILKDEPDGA